MRISKRPVTMSMSKAILPFNLLLVSRSPSPRTNCGVTVRTPSIRTLARIAPATSPTPVTARADSRSGTRIGHLGADVDEAGVVELHPGRSQPVGIIGGPERAVEGPHQPHVAARHVGEQRRRAQQVDAQADFAETVGGEVERAARHRPQGWRADRQLAVEHAVLQPAVAAHLHQRRGQPLQSAFEELRRSDLAG